MSWLVDSLDYDEDLGGFADYSEYGDEENFAQDYDFRKIHFSRHDNYSDAHSVSSEETTDTEWKTIDPSDEDYLSVLSWTPKDILRSRLKVPYSQRRRYSASYGDDLRLEFNRANYAEYFRESWNGYTDELPAPPMIDNGEAGLFLDMSYWVYRYYREWFEELDYRSTVLDEHEMYKIRNAAIRREKKRGKKKKQRYNRKNRLCIGDGSELLANNDSNVPVRSTQEDTVSDHRMENIELQNGVIPVASAEDIEGSIEFENCFHTTGSCPPVTTYSTNDEKKCV